MDEAPLRRGVESAEQSSGYTTRLQFLLEITYLLKHLVYLADLGPEAVRTSGKNL
jgi:hypothetical protein